MSISIAMLERRTTAIIALIKRATKGQTGKSRLGRPPVGTK